MGYIFSFLLGFFVASEGISNVVSTVDTVVVKTKQYIKKNISNDY